MTTNWDHFRRAAQVLVGPGPVKQRLCEAYLGHLGDISPDDLPLELQAGLAALHGAMHSATAAGGLGTVEATVRKMSEAEAGLHAAEVLEMLVALSRPDAREPAMASPRQLRLVGDDDIPSFLNRA